MRRKEDSSLAAPLHIRSRGLRRSHVFSFFFLLPLPIHLSHSFVVSIHLCPPLPPRLPLPEAAGTKEEGGPCLCGQLIAFRRVDRDCVYKNSLCKSFAYVPLSQPRECCTRRIALNFFFSHFPPHSVIYPAFFVFFFSIRANREH